MLNSMDFLLTVIQTGLTSNSNNNNKLAISSCFKQSDTNQISWNMCERA